MCHPINCIIIFQRMKYGSSFSFKFRPQDIDLLDSGLHTTQRPCFCHTSQYRIQGGGAFPARELPPPPPTTHQNVLNSPSYGTHGSVPCLQLHYRAILYDNTDGVTFSDFINIEHLHQSRTSKVPSLSKFCLLTALYLIDKCAQGILF